MPVPASVLIAQPGTNGRPAIAAEAGYAVAGHGVDDAIRADAANADVALVVDVEAAVRRHRQADDAPELRQPRRAAIAAIAYGSRAGNGGDDAVWGHLSHQGAALADIQAAVRADRDREGTAEGCGRGWTAVTTRRLHTQIAVSRHRGDDPVGRHAADLVQERVGDVQAAVWPEGQPLRADRRRGGGSAIAAGAAHADAPLVEGADEVAPRPKHGDLIARPRACDRVARVVAEAVRSAVFRRIDVANADRDRLLALNDPAVGVFAVPGERGALVGRGREGLLVELAGDADFQLDAQQSVRQLGFAERNLHLIGNVPTGHALTLVVQCELRAHDSERFAQDLVLALDHRAGCLAGVVAVLANARILARCDCVIRRPDAPVGVPWLVEVRDEHPPQGLARRVQGGELPPLVVADRERCQRGRTVGYPIAVGIQVGQAVSDTQDLENESALGRDPDPAGAAVAA